MPSKNMKTFAKNHPKWNYPSNLKIKRIHKIFGKEAVKKLVNNTLFNAPRSNENKYRYNLTLWFAKILNVPVLMTSPRGTTTRITPAGRVTTFHLSAIPHRSQKRV